MASWKSLAVGTVIANEETDYIHIQLTYDDDSALEVLVDDFSFTWDNEDL
jgi:uncharacterized protein (DUF1499 family)